MQREDAAMAEQAVALLSEAIQLSLLQAGSKKPGFETSAVQDNLDESPKDPALLLYAAQIWSLSSPPDLRSSFEEFSSRTANDYNQIANSDLRANLIAVEQLNGLIEGSPYLAPTYLLLAMTYIRLRYPDLAAAAAYKALLLFDAISDDSDEYHQSALRVFEKGVDRWSALINETDEEKTMEIGISNHRLETYLLLARSLQQCGCLKSAHVYCNKSLQTSQKHAGVQKLLNDIEESARLHFGEPALSTEHKNPMTWPDSGLVRRECYPWNSYEPNRLDDLEVLNNMMHAVAPKLEVKATRLPALSSTTGGGAAEEVVQLGVFAREYISPGEVILKETSLLTANNKLQDALCDACSVELPDLGSADTVACDDCQIVFCSQTCYDEAIDSYHPALCEREVEAIAKDVPPSEASDSLYSLLLLRSLAMAETQNCHPLSLQEVKYIWGDFNDINYARLQHADSAPKTLPFSFKYNITLPYHMLEKMDIDIFATTKYDIWVFNTLYAKFRGTASARLSGLGGRAIRGPEVCAVHPMWCLANHSCDPNVSWDWGGEITFRCRKQRVEWQGTTKSTHNQAGVKRGEELLNHYCDIDLPVQERREWARGALGGNCMCERCVWEAG